MQALHLLPHWSSQYWFDLILSAATAVEASALWLLYRLERQQDKRNTRVELPIRLYESMPKDDEGNQTGPIQPLLEVTNCAATAVYIEKVTLELELQNGRTAAAVEKAGRLIKPYSTDTINVLWLSQNVVQQVRSTSVSKGDAGHAVYKDSAKVTVTYRAYGKHAETEPTSFEGEIRWGEFHLR